MIEIEIIYPESHKCPHDIYLFSNYQLVSCSFIELVQNHSHAITVVTVNTGKIKYSLGYIYTTVFNSNTVAIIEEQI